MRQEATAIEVTSWFLMPPTHLRPKFQCRQVLDRRPEHRVHGPVVAEEEAALQLRAHGKVASRSETGKRTGRVAGWHWPSRVGPLLC